MLKVSSGSNPHAVAGAIAAALRAAGTAEAHAIGAGAVNQAVKAIAIARDYLRGQGLDCACVPSFVEVDVEGSTRTAIRLQVEVRTTPAAAALDGGGLDAGAVLASTPGPALDSCAPAPVPVEPAGVIVLDDAEALAPATPPGL